MDPRSAICPICGRTFTPATPSSKYCSATCRHEGRRQARKAWELRTNYREKQRAAAQEYRDQKAADAALEAADAAAREENNRRRRQARQSAKATAALEAQARTGDPLAALSLLSSTGKKDTAEYWEAFKAYELAQAAARPGGRVMYVNGIAIGDPDFSLKVTITIQETGRIIAAFC